MPPLKSTPSATSLNASSSDKRALVVAGMHRSGTSAVARAMALLGAGLPRDLMDRGTANPLGHWEPQPVVDLNDAILADFGGRWNEPDALPVYPDTNNIFERYGALARELIRAQFAGQRLIVLKDPRISLLAEFWNLVLEAEGYAVNWIIMVRHPQEVAASLIVRDGMAPIHACRLWMRYMASVDVGTLDRPRLFCAYNDLIDDSIGSLDRITASLSLPEAPASARDAAIAFLDARHRHHDLRGKSRDRVARMETPLRFPLAGGIALLWTDAMAKARDRSTADGVSSDVLNLMAQAPQSSSSLSPLRNTRWLLRKGTRILYRLALGCELERRRVKSGITRRLEEFFQRPRQ